MQALAPLVIFLYKRPEVTKQMLDSVNKNSLSGRTDVFIFCDGYKDASDRESVEVIREIAHDFAKHSCFKSVTIKESATNKGLANSIISGVTEVIYKYGKVIVLEDDLLTSHNFLDFMNDCLDFYEDDVSVWSIGGTLRKMKYLEKYKKDVYAHYRVGSWGWATWLNRWERVDWNVSDYDSFIKDRKKKRLFNRGGSDLTGMLRAQHEGKIDSWAVRWSYQANKENMISIFPRKSLIKNIGFGEEATHTVFEKDIYETQCCEDFIYHLEHVEIDEHLMREYRWYLSRVYRTIVAWRIKINMLSGKIDMKGN